MVLYIDVAILSGFVLNLMCFDTAASVLGIKVRKGRLMAGAFLLSAMSLLCLVDCRIRILFLLLYIPAVKVIFGTCRLPELIRRTGVCICSNLLYTSMLLCIIPSRELWFLNVGNSTFYVPEDIWFYLPLGAVYIAVKFIMYLVTRSKKIYQVKISMGDKTVVTDAMVDTGNSLREPVTQKPVIIVERSLTGDVDSEPRIIPYKNIGSSCGYTKIYPVERLCLLDEHTEFSDIYAVLVDKPLSRTGQYKVLLHNSFVV